MRALFCLSALLVLGACADSPAGASSSETTGEAHQHSFDAPATGSILGGDADTGSDVQRSSGASLGSRPGAYRQ